MNLRQIAENYKFDRSAKTEFIKAALGDLRVKWRLLDSDITSESSLYIVSYKASKGSIYLIFPDKVVAVPKGKFWETIIKNLDSIMATQPQKYRGVTAHRLFMPSNGGYFYAWFSTEHEDVFCENEGFTELCDSLGLKIVTEESE